LSAATVPGTAGARQAGGSGWGPTRPPAPAKRRISRVEPQDVVLLVASLVASFAAVWLVFEEFLLLSGAAGFVVCWIAFFLFIFWLSNVQVNGRLVANDRLWGAILGLGALGLAVPLVLIIVFLVGHGYRVLSVHFFLKDQRGLGPLSPVGAGGVGHAILGTLEQVGFAVLIGAPLGIATAVFLHEVGGRLTSTIRVVVTAMSGLPSIVAGIFVYSIWVVALGEGFSGFAGSLALSMMLLPSIARTSEEVLKLVPGGLREASMALGAPDWRTVWSVVLPVARPGIVTAVLLGIARVAGETAPLLVTIFGSTYYNTNLFHGDQEALPLFVYTHVKLPLASQIQLAYGAALALAIVVFALFLAARIASGRRPEWLKTLPRRLTRRAGAEGR
jgi:phosphate transport system permease protein